MFGQSKASLLLMDWPSISWCNYIVLYYQNMYDGFDALRVVAKSKLKWNENDITLGDFTILNDADRQYSVCHFFNAFQKLCNLWTVPTIIYFATWHFTVFTDDFFIFKIFRVLFNHLTWINWIRRVLTWTFSLSFWSKMGQNDKHYRNYYYWSHWQANKIVGNKQ